MQFASPKEEGWRYALLLVILIAIATIATHTAINYINPLVRPREQTVVTAILCALTFGLMLISASFAVWAMRFSAESESRRRLGQMVNAMTYIRDGVLLLDRNGSITGANPTARSLFDLSHSDLSTLAELFSDLSAHDRDLLLHSDHPEEVECFGGNILPGHTLRLRSQPSRGSILLLVSDVTRLTDGRARRRRAAYLQLMGHIAQGVANDFNNLLCGIEGHA
jgi:PAS domain-containing protein